jgi:hypothetical protein
LEDYCSLRTTRLAPTYPQLVPEFKLTVTPEIPYFPIFYDEQ